MKFNLEIPEKAYMKNPGSIPSDFYHMVINHPEYQAYCESYGFTDVFHEKTVKGFVIWKRFGTAMYGVENSRHVLNEYFENLKPSIYGYGDF